MANVAYTLIIILALGYLLSIGKMVIAPIIFAIIISFLLYPLCLRLEKWKFSRVWAIVTSMLGVIVLLVGLIALFTTLFAGLFNDLDTFKRKLVQTMEDALEWIATIPILHNNLEPLIKEGGMGWVDKFSAILGSTLVSSTAFLGYLVMVIVYVFLFLLYRTAFKKFILSWFSDERSLKMEAMLYQFQKVTQSYFGGLLIAICIIGTINSIGLYFIGIEHALLFGFFASFLTVVPYIGTTLGGLLPLIFAFFNYDELWRPIAVLIFYQVVQTVEGNYITPKIVGDKVSVNPLVAIVVLIVGGFFWGIVGMVLSLPLTAIARVLLSNFEQTKPFAYLLSNDFKSKE